MVEVVVEVVVGVGVVGVRPVSIKRQEAKHARPAASYLIRRPLHVRKRTTVPRGAGKQQELRIGAGPEDAAYRG